MAVANEPTGNLKIMIMNTNGKKVDDTKADKRKQVGGAPSQGGPASVSCEDGICVPEGQEKWMYGNCVQFLILVCGTSSPGNAHTCQMS
jgi:hypothetical protein